MTSIKGTLPLLRRMIRPISTNSTRNLRLEPGIPPVGPDNAVLSNAADVQRQNLERRLQAQLKDGGRSKDVKRLSDPLVRHLLRVSGNQSYRSVRQSVIVTGKTLICELLLRFPCRRLIGRPRGLAELNSRLTRVQKLACGSYSPRNPAGQDFDLSLSSSPLNADIETHTVSNRILRKVAGLHSYDDGCLAEMRIPKPALDMGNIRLLLCLDSGAIGTLLRSAAALQWQGIWILPSCPDVFDPLAIRASQGALFWLPYRRGTALELVKFCREKNLTICVPHSHGVPVTTPGIFEGKMQKGVCLVLDSAIIDGQVHNMEVERHKTSNDPSSSVSDFPSLRRSANAGKGAGRTCSFVADLALSLGSDVAPRKSLQLLHPITVASLMLYHTKMMHFPDVQGSPFVFPLKQKN